MSTMIGCLRLASPCSLAGRGARLNRPSSTARLPARAVQRSLRAHGRRPCMTTASAGKGMVSGAPDISDTPQRSPAPPPPPPPPPPSASTATILWRRTLRSLSSLNLAIGELAVIAGLSAIGTVIPQNQAVSFYIQNYPDGANKVLGFVTYDLILGLQWDHIYTAEYFIFINLLLGASLAACSFTRQLPVVKIARKWSFAKSATAVARLGQYNKTLPSARLSDLGRCLSSQGYQIFQSGGALYGFKGIAGRYAPIGVHISMLLIMFGVIFGAVGGYKGSAMVPSGGQFMVADAILPYSPLASPPSGASALVSIDDFRITYRDNGQVEQYFTDMRVTDPASGATLQEKTINVNEPLRVGGVTMYQTDWSIAAIKLRVKGGEEYGEAFLTPMANLEGKGVLGGKAWGSFLPTGPPPGEGQPPPGISIIARDLQAVTFYNSAGEFAGVRRTDSGTPLAVNGVELVVDGMVGSTGLEIKVDPGVPFVYAGFGGMMVTTLLSYISHSQVWACQDEDDVHVGGKTNRATITFEQEMDAVLDEVPEVQSS
mmetsp:Transcript_27118/g.68229  ORF Transcript_27118/g.68229 Transcript_27118/m.68229 type:complete len:543 (-) Transcript_27118:140-1768(-)